LLNREDAFKILEPIGLAVMQDKELSEEEEKAIKELLIAAMKK